MWRGASWWKRSVGNQIRISRKGKGAMQQGTNNNKGITTIGSLTPKWDRPTCISLHPFAKTKKKTESLCQRTKLLWNECALFVFWKHGSGDSAWRTTHLHVSFPCATAAWISKKECRSMLQANAHKDDNVKASKCRAKSECDWNTHRDPADDPPTLHWCFCELYDPTIYVRKSGLRITY